MKHYHIVNTARILCAAQILDVLDGQSTTYNPMGWRGLRLQGHRVVLPVPDGWLELHKPVAGGYLVQDENANTWTVPEREFLEVYTRASPADEGEYTVWPIRTHAGAGEAVLAAVCDAARARGHEVLTDGQAHVLATITAFEWSSTRPGLYTVSYSDGHGETLVLSGEKLGGRAPKLGDLLVRTADGQRIVPGAPTVALMEEGRETTFENLAAEMDSTGATGWASRVRELGARVAPPLLRLDTDVAPGDVEAFRRQWNEAIKGVNTAWCAPVLVAGAPVAAALPTRVTKEALEAMFRSVAYEIRPDGRTTVCEIVFHNGFTLRGESSAACAENFRADLGEKYAYEKALDAAWGFAGFLLMEDRHRAAA